MSPSRWAQDARHRRWLLVGAWVLVLAQVGATLVAVIAVTQVSDLTFSDRLAEIGDWVVGGTLTLAVEGAQNLAQNPSSARRDSVLATQRQACIAADIARGANAY